MFKKGKTRSRREHKKGSSLTKCIIAIVIAGVAWMGLTMAESYILMDKNVTIVCIAKSDIPKGTIITSENVDSFFSEKSVNSELVSKTTVTDKTEIVGKILVNISEGEIVSSNEFVDTAYAEESFANPKIYSFSVTSATSAVNGLIREGDLVDIYATVTDEGGDTFNKLIKGNVYIRGAYDSSLAAINSSDTTTLATSFIIYLIFSTRSI